MREDRSSHRRRALTIACLAASMAIVRPAAGALAQAKQAPQKQAAPPPGRAAAARKLRSSRSR